MLVPLSESFFDSDGLGDLLKIIETSIQSHNPPRLKGKDVGDMARITFSTSNFVCLAGLASQESTIKVTLPVSVIAVATNQVANVMGLKELLSTSNVLPWMLCLTDIFTSEIRSPSTSRV